jgi:hypothetical protein
MIAIARAGFNKKEILFNSKLDLNLRKNLVSCYIFTVDFHGAEILILLEVAQK